VKLGGGAFYLFWAIRHSVAIKNRFGAAAPNESAVKGVKSFVELSYSWGATLCSQNAPAAAKLRPK
jgi:hypothetical protein